MFLSSRRRGLSNRGLWVNAWVPAGAATMQTAGKFLLLALPVPVASGASWCMASLQPTMIANAFTHAPSCLSISDVGVLFIRSLRGRWVQLKLGLEFLFGLHLLEAIARGPARRWPLAPSPLLRLGASWPWTQPSGPRGWWCPWDLEDGPMDATKARAGPVRGASPGAAPML